MFASPAFSNEGVQNVSIFRKLASVPDDAATLKAMAEVYLRSVFGPDAEEIVDTKNVSILRESDTVSWLTYSNITPTCTLKIKMVKGKYGFMADRGNSDKDFKCTSAKPALPTPDPANLAPPPGVDLQWMWHS